MLPLPDAGKINTTPDCQLCEALAATAHIHLNTMRANNIIKTDQAEQRW